MSNGMFGAQRSALEEARRAFKPSPFEPRSLPTMPKASTLDSF